MSVLNTIASVTVMMFVWLCSSQAFSQEQKGLKHRDFLFTYAATVTKLKPHQRAKLWIPIPPNTKSQKVKVAVKKLRGKVRRTKEPTFGNDFYYIETKASITGLITLGVTYQIRRYEVQEDKLSDEDRTNDVFLKSNTKVPIGGKPVTLIPKDKVLPEDQLALAQELFHIVNNHMTYSKKGKGWGTGDAVWACDSGYGNCTDFHSLFISLSRSKGVPAKFEIGFALPEQRGSGDIAGYHCWAQFRPKNRGWIPVDISQANQAKTKNPKLAEYLFGHLTENRVTFSVGRDIELNPKQSGPPLNFFIYPHVEVNGEVVDPKTIIHQFRYHDLQPGVK